MLRKKARDFEQYFWLGATGIFYPILTLPAAGRLPLNPARAGQAPKGKMKKIPSMEFIPQSGRGVWGVNKLFTYLSS